MPLSPDLPDHPRNEERVRRRATQNAAVDQAARDVAVLPPTSEEQAHIVARNAAALAADGDTQRERVQAQQARNATAAEAEIVALPTLDINRPVLVEGSQASLVMANRLARAHDTEELDLVTLAGKAAGRAVRDLLLDTQDGEIAKRYGRQVQHNAAADVAAAAAAKKE